MAIWLGIVFVLFLLLVVLPQCFDVWYFVRAIIHHFSWSEIPKHTDVLAESIYYSFCWTTDLDFMVHMNNARYSRECDFARFKLWTMNNVYRTVLELKGHLVLGAMTIRFRRSLHFLDKITIRSKVLCWDNKAFYLEQSIERTSDNFVCAILYGKQSIVGDITTTDILRHLTGEEMTSPDIPEHIKKWIECNQISSDILRKKD